MKVLISTAGIGSRLGNLTKYLNKSLVRVGKKASISYIIESYPKDSEFIICLGYYGNLVSQYIKLAHPEINVTYVQVDKYDGEGSSLLYSIYCAKKHLQQPFIFHACDTILDKNLDLSLDDNWIVGFKKTDSSQYRSINVVNRKVIKFFDKGEINSDYDYVGVCGIKDYKLFWEISDRILGKPDNSFGNSDCDILSEMFSIHKFHFIESKRWIDIGNIESLRIARKEIEDSFHLLDKEDENIYIFNNFVIKYFYNKVMCSNRVKRAKELDGLTPKLLDHTDNFYKYEYASGDLLSENININMFQELLKWSEKKLWLKKEVDNLRFKEKCLDFYKTKTINRIKSFLNKNNIEDKEEYINGILVPKIENLLSLVDYSQLSNQIPTGYHGDFILENILFGEKEFILLDWRQDFSGEILYGDKNYDLAKLNHNLIVNHDVIYKNLYKTKFLNNNIECDIMVKKNLLDCKEQLKKYCLNKKIDFSNIEILTSLIWINMSPLHEHPIDKFLYYFGKYNLFLNLK